MIDFILTPGQWIGEGKIAFSISHETLRFYTKWTVEKNISGVITCQQQVEMEGREETLFNYFTLSNITDTDFSIELTNSLLGSLKGKGVLSPKTIAWEFIGSDDFEGFEVYEMQENGQYHLHAEFSSTDDYRTIINGKIWKKETS